MSKQNDLISRQAAIEALGEEPLVWRDSDEEIAEHNQWERDVEAIKTLPLVPSIPIEWIEEYSNRLSRDHEKISAWAIDDMLGAWREESNESND